MVAQKQKPGLYIQIFLLVLVLFSFIVGYYFFENTKITIALFSLSYCLKYIVEGYFSYEYSKGTNTPNKL
jgi:hypothetical protein